LSGAALKDSGKQSINNDWKIELPGEFELAGTTVRYVRRGLWEKMSAKGPTKTPLHLMVKTLGHNIHLSLSYLFTVFHTFCDAVCLGKLSVQFQLRLILFL